MIHKQEYVQKLGIPHSYLVLLGRRESVYTLLPAPGGSWHQAACAPSADKDGRNSPSDTSPGQRVHAKNVQGYRSKKTVLLKTEFYVVCMSNPIKTADFLIIHFLLMFYVNYLFFSRRTNPSGYQHLVPLNCLIFHNVHSCTYQNSHWTRIAQKGSVLHLPLGLGPQVKQGPVLLNSPTHCHTIKDAASIQLSSQWKCYCLYTLRIFVWI